MIKRKKKKKNHNKGMLMDGVISVAEIDSLELKAASDM